MADGARRDLTLLATGQAVSVAGDAAALVALLLRLQPSGSGWVAALLAGELIPFIVFAPLSGTIVDRTETRQVLLISLIGQALVALPLALITTPWATVLLFAALNALSTLVRPATAAIVPAIVGGAEATQGYARLATGAGLGFIVGPALGGLVTGKLGDTTALIIDAATFAALALATAFVRARRPPRRDGAGSPTGKGASSTWAGFAFLWRTAALRIALLVTALAVGCAVVDNVAAPFRFIDQLGTTDTGYGTYLTVWGFGALIGTRLLRRLDVSNHAVTLATGNLLSGIGIAGIGLAPNLGIALVASAVGGVGNGFANVSQNALIASSAPPALHGRAFAAGAAIIQTAIGVGTAAAAPLVAILGAGNAMTTAGGLAALAALGALVSTRYAVRRRTGAI